MLFRWVTIRCVTKLVSWPPMGQDHLQQLFFILSKNIYIHIYICTYIDIKEKTNSPFSFFLVLASHRHAFLFSWGHGHWAPIDLPRAELVAAIAGARWSTRLGSIGPVCGFFSCFYACKKELSATSTHAWCRATARSSATSTHTWCYAGVGWGGMLTFIGTHTHTWCYATARSSATSTHTWCYATARSSATSTHTWCYATARSSATVLIRLRASWRRKNAERVVGGKVKPSSSETPFFQSKLTFRYGETII